MCREPNFDVSGQLSLVFKVSARRRCYGAVSLGNASRDGNPCGSIGIFDAESDALLSTLDIDTTMGVDGFHHPHHARWLPNGDLVTCTWGTPRIALWRRLP